MAKAVIKRVGADHPDVCQGTTGKAGCEYQACVGSKFCQVHGGQAAPFRAQAIALRNYKLDYHGDRANTLAGSPGIKSLMDEIVLMRLSLEMLYNQIKDPADVLLYTDRVAKLTDGIMKLLLAAQTLQEKNKELVTHDVVFGILDDLMGVISTVVADPDALKQIADAGSDAIQSRLGITL